MKVIVCEKEFLKKNNKTVIEKDNEIKVVCDSSDCLNEIVMCQKNMPYADLIKSENFINITNRETDIIKLIVYGLSNKEIASRLNIAEGTVRNIISNILSKTCLLDRTQLAVYAVMHNLV